MTFVILLPIWVVLLGLFCWVIYKASVYAFPCALGFVIAKWAFDTGAGPLVSAVVFLLVGAIAHFGGQFLYVKLWWPPARFALATIYCVPSGAVGYAVSRFALGVMGDSAPTGMWREVFVWTWVTLTAGITLARLAQVAFFIGDPDRELKRQAALIDTSAWEAARRRGGSPESPPPP